MKTALIAGGAGFIGSHLCEKLLEKKYSVICVDNFETSSRKNILKLFKNKNFKFIKQDITKNFKVKGKIDEIYSLASIASPILYSKKTLTTAMTNAFGMKKMLDLASTKKAKIFFSSTSETYGDPLVHPQKESYTGNVNAFSLRACYDESKRFAETLCFLYSKEKKVKIRIARIFNTYGPKMNPEDGRVIPSFIVNSLKNKNIVIFGNGKQTRSFCFVDDLVDGIYKLMQSSYDKPVNLGNPNEMTINELAKKIIKLNKSKSKIIFKKMMEGDPSKRKPDISLAKRKLGWKPKTNLNEGLEKTIDYFKSI